MHMKFDRFNECKRICGQRFNKSCQLFMQPPFSGVQLGEGGLFL